MTDTVYIYALCDPDDGRMYYIGCSTNPTLRLGGHRARAIAGEIGPKHEWVRTVLARGHQPLVRVLETTTNDIGWRKEGEWIARLRAAGEPLLNLRTPHPSEAHKLGVRRRREVERNKNTEVVEVRFPPAIVARLRQLAELDHRSLNGEIVKAVEDWLAGYSIADQPAQPQEPTP